MTAPLTALRAQLAGMVAPVPLEARGLATGLAALDAALPARGIPTGRLTEVVGERGSGKTAWLRQFVERTAARGLWVAYVDAGRTLAPRDWAGSGEGLWVIRPPAPARGAWCADVLLRSGAFALVVLDGAPPLSRGVAVRLTRLAREAGAALVVVGEDAGRVTEVPGALRLRVERRGDGGVGTGDWRFRRRARSTAGGQPSSPHLPRGHPVSGRRQRLTILVEKGGRRQRVEVSYGVAVASRLCTHPEVADRRGVGRSAGSSRVPAGGLAKRADGRGGAGSAAAPRGVLDSRGPRPLPAPRSPHFALRAVG